MNCVPETAVFEPPEPAAGVAGTNLAIAGNGGDILQRERRRNELHGMPRVLGIEVQRMAKQVAAVLRRRESFSKFAAALGAHSKGRAGEERYDPITRGVAEQRRR